MSWTLLRLGNHLDIQRKVQDELDSIFEGDKTRPITLDDIRRMNYLEMVIKESLRMHPPGPMIMRELKSSLELGKQNLGLV
jgi:cytochrome P450 family 4